MSKSFKDGQVKSMEERKARKMYHDKEDREVLQSTIEEMEVDEENEAWSEMLDSHNLSKILKR